MRRAAVTLAIAVAALGGGASAQASAPEVASGTFAAPPPVPDRVTTAGRNCFVELDDRFVLAGTLAGTLDLDFRLVFHGPCFASRGEFHAKGTFTGTATTGGVARTGTVQAVFNGVFAGPEAEGKLVLRQGDGGLTGLHGVLVLTGTPGVGGTYSGSVHVEDQETAASYSS
ncbi:MAG: hypothetical protein ACRDNE_14850 [Gaiellaceae bacterium]